MKAQQLAKEITRINESTFRQTQFKEATNTQKVQKRIQNKHLKELKALEIKIATNWTQLKAQREKELETLKKQFVNAKLDIDVKYKNRWLKIDSTTKSRPKTVLNYALLYYSY